MQTYILPPLDYDYGALEPYISGRIMELHHSKHHAAYVKNANLTMEQLNQARKNLEFEKLPALEKALAFNVSGHILHSLFWKNLQPNGGGRPPATLLNAIERDFGGFDDFRMQLVRAAATIMGSGWAALTWEPLAGRLVVTQIYDHQSNVSQAGIPLMVLDAWEHAYYLQYENRKTEYFLALWNLWNWKDIAQRFDKARDMDLQLAA